MNAFTLIILCEKFLFHSFPNCSMVFISLIFFSHLLKTARGYGLSIIFLTFFYRSSEKVKVNIAFLLLFSLLHFFYTCMEQQCKTSSGYSLYLIVFLSFLCNSKVYNYLSSLTPVQYNKTKCIIIFPL